MYIFVVVVVVSLMFCHPSTIDQGSIDNIRCCSVRQITSPSIPRPVFYPFFVKLLHLIIEMCHNSCTCDCIKF